MLYLAISIVIYGLMNNAVGWYQAWAYYRGASVVKRGTLVHDGMRYKVTPI